MRRVFVGVYTSKPLKMAALLMAVAIATTAVGAYAATRSADTINACSTKQTGQLRLNTGTGCLPTEQAVQWRPAHRARKDRPETRTAEFVTSAGSCLTRRL
jgi:hypothetical protein